MISSLIIYSSVSLITGRGKKSVNLDRLLHRGQYAVDVAPIEDEYHGSKWLKIAGITKEFGKSDRFLAIFLVTWNALNFLWFVIFSLINLLRPVSDHAWTTYWHISILITAALALPCTVWFTVGGVIDIRALFRHLDAAVRDQSDDGRVKHEPETPSQSEVVTEAEDILKQPGESVRVDD